MADTYTVNAQYPGVIFLGGTQTQDVMFVGITTKPNGVYLEFPIPKTLYSPAQVNNFAGGYSGTVEAIFAITQITAMEWIQIPSGGNLESAMLITVTSDSGNSTGEITVPFGSLGVPFVRPLVNKLVASLNAAEAL